MLNNQKLQWKIISRTKTSFAICVDNQQEDLDPTGLIQTSQGGCKGALTSSVSQQHRKLLTTTLHLQSGLKWSSFVGPLSLCAKEIHSLQRPFKMSLACLSLWMNGCDICIRGLWHHKRGTLPKEPDNIAELTIAEEWTTIGGDNSRCFLLHYSGIDNHPCIIVLPADEGLQILGVSDIWKWTGTFSTHPRIFTQLYTTHVSLGNTAVSCRYAFLKSKSQDIYEVAPCQPWPWVTCHDLGFSSDPRTIVIDFEMATLQAFLHCLEQASTGRDVSTTSVNMAEDTGPWFLSI